MNTAELEANVRNTIAFIAANSVSLILIPRTKTKDGTGLHYTDGAPRPPQTLRLIDQTPPGAQSPSPGLVQAADGRERLADFILLGPPDAIIRVDDYWRGADGTYEVTELFPFNGYEVRAKVTRHA